MNLRRSVSFAFLFSLILTLIYAGFLANTPFFWDARAMTRDTFFKLRTRYSAPSPYLKDIVVIGVDDESIAKINRAWPWGREVFAVFLERLSRSGPRVVGFDFSIVGESADTETDRWLSEALAKNPNAILSSYFDEKGQHVWPHAPFVRSAEGVGYVEKPLDRDGVNRRLQNQIVSKGETFYSFGAWVAMRSQGKKPDALAEYFMPEHLVSYRYPTNAFQYLSIWKVLNEENAIDDLKDKIILVGAVTPLLHDIHMTPLGLMPGVCMLGNEIIMMLENDRIWTLESSGELWLLGALVLLLCFVFLKLNFVGRLWLWLGLLIGGFVSMALVFISTGLVLDYFSYALLLTFVYSAVVVEKGFSTFLENLRLQRLVIMDSLTGLYGHRYLTLRLESEFSKSQRTANAVFYLAMLDVDHFKKVNDTYGHEQGNVVLVTLASLLKSGIRGYDVAARYGGEEFAIILFHSDEDKALLTVERIRQSIEAQVFQVHKVSFHVTISIGLCSTRQEGMRSKEQLIECADRALYEAKNQGRNRTVIHKVNQP